MGKADVENRDKLRHGFPAEYKVYWGWYYSKDPIELFKIWGFDPELIRNGRVILLENGKEVESFKRHPKMDEKDEHKE